MGVETWRGEDHAEKAAEIGGMQPQAKSCQGLLADGRSGKGKKGSSPAVAVLDFWHQGLVL